MDFISRFLTGSKGFSGVSTGCISDYKVYTVLDRAYRDGGSLEAVRSFSGFFL